MRRLSLLAFPPVFSAVLFSALTFASTDAVAAPPKLPPAGGATEPEVPAPTAAPAATPAAPAPGSPAPAATTAPTAPAADGTEPASDEPTAPSEDAESGEAEDAGDTETSEDAETSGASPDDPTLVRGREEPMMQTIRGSVGLFYTQLPRVGAKYSFRFGVHTDVFKSKRLFIDDTVYGPDTHSRLRSTVNLGFTFTKYTEIFFSLHGASNRNVRDTPIRLDPTAIYALGDMDFGVKGAWRGVRGGGVGIGGTVGINLVSGAGKLVSDRVGFYVDGIIGADLRYLTERAIPVRFTANIGYFQDNSYKVANFGLIDDLPSREIARFGLGAMQPRVRTRLAIDAPLRLGKDKQVGLDPILEYSLDISTKQNDDFLELTEIGGASPAPRLASWLTVGLRANVYSGLHLDAAVDIGTTSPNYEYGPPTPPYQVILGLGWAFDPMSAVKEETVVEEKPAEPPPPATGRVIGSVVDAAGTPIGDARISIPSSGGSIILTDAAGTFVGYSLPPGPADVILTPASGEPITQTIEVVGGEDAVVTFMLAAPEPEPAPPAGLLDGTFTDETGAGVAAYMQVTGGTVDERFIINEAGRIRLSLDYGEYQANVTAEGFEPLSITFSVDAESVSVSGTLKRDVPPETPNISGSSSRIRLKRGIRYSGSNVSSSSHEILNELAVFLKYHPEYKLVEVQVHTDDRGSPRSRSSSRAESVISYLSGQGVDPSRLKARGLGDSQPVAVNLTEAGRRKNNRTVLRVRKYTGDE